MKHLILYDAPCSLCNWAIRFVIKRDVQNQFLFAPLGGKTAQTFRHLISTNKDTLLFIENYQTSTQRVYFRSRAVFRILWKLGGVWKCVGFNYLLPSWMIDWIYRLIARKRHKVCKVCPFKSQSFEKKGRFLP